MTRVTAAVLALAVGVGLAGPASAQDAAPYVPGPAGDWERVDPRDAGMDPDLLQEAMDYALERASEAPRDLEENHYRGGFAREPFGEAIGPFKERGEPTGVVLRGGRIVAEWGEPHRVDQTFSVTKSFLTATVGAAYDRGLIPDLHDPVHETMAPVFVLEPGCVDPGPGARPEPRGYPAGPAPFEPFASDHAQRITWDHLLRQTSDWQGMLWCKPDWSDRPSGDDEEWIDREPAEPGEVYEYNDVRVNLLALASMNVWQRPLPEVLREEVMEPIGASRTWHWQGYRNSWVVLDGRRAQAVSGGAHWGGGMFISARDLARFGLLEMRDGKWDGRRVLSEGFLEMARTPGEANSRYGFMNFFLNTGRESMPAAPESARSHRGAGANIVYVDPENDVVAVLRWVQSGALSGFVERLLESIEAGGAPEGPADVGEGEGPSASAAGEPEAGKAEEAAGEPEAENAAADAGEPEATYWVYVLAESSDEIHRVRFGPEGARVEATSTMADLYRQSSRADLLTSHEDPHGVQVSPDGETVYVTTGHGQPDGKLWKLEAGTGRLLADPVDLGPFPASMDVSPDGAYAYVVNFDLHGPMLPSTVSAVATGGMREAARIEACAMPHGSRFHPTGAHHYSVCMMDDQLVEVDVEAREVSRRFFLGEGEEGPLAADDLGFHADLELPEEGHHDHQERGRQRLPHEHAYHATCSPTWVQPSHDGRRIYVACNGNDTVLEIDFDGWELTRRFETGTGPYNVDVTFDDRILVATLKQGDGVEFIDLESGETAAREETSTGVVHGIAISPDDRYAFVSVEGVGGEPGKVDVFHLGTFERVASVEVGSMASGIAFWRMEEAGAEGTPE